MARKKPDIVSCKTEYNILLPVETSGRREGALEPTCGLVRHVIIVLAKSAMQ
jgi:hypothetical protein